MPEPTTPSRHEVRQQIRERLSGMPPPADSASGRTVLDDQLTAEATARRTAADVAAAASLAGTVETTAHGMRPNPAQGASAMSAPLSSPTSGRSPLDRIRDITARANFDGGTPA